MYTVPKTVPYDIGLDKLFFTLLSISISMQAPNSGSKYNTPERYAKETGHNGVLLNIYSSLVWYRLANVHMLNIWSYVAAR